MEKERVLITGGCGFVGVNLVAFLRKHSNFEIAIIDNLSLGKAEHVREFDVCLIEGDIRDPISVGRAMHGASYVIHLAADTRVIDSVQNPEKNFDVNVIGTFRLLEQARKRKIKKFVFASTGGAIMGSVPPPVHEGMVPRPDAPYGASKLSGEGYLSAYSKVYGLSSIALRFSNVYGPRSFHKGSVVAQFFKDVIASSEIKVYGDGSQTRDFVHVEDICRAIYCGLTHDRATGVYQLGSGTGTSVNRLLAEIGKIVGPNKMPGVRYLPFRKGEIIHTYCAIERARRDLDYNPARSLEDGLAETWAWFASQSQLDEC